jgi:uracil phosphoribosyltransferase
MSTQPPVPSLSPPQPAHHANTNLAHLNPLPKSVFTLTQTAQLEALYTIIRDKNTSRGDFLFYSDRIIRLLVEEGLNHLPVVKRTVETPTVSSEF